MRLILCCLTLLLLVACNNQENSQRVVSNTTPMLNFSLVNSYPHDINAFTEGFLFYDGKLFESTGATRELPQTRSLFGVVDLKTGQIDVKVEIDRNKYFGEGITFLNGKVYQLTYQTRIGFVYDAVTFKKIREFPLPTAEGWGMTTDGVHLIMSDGTHNLTYLDPASLQVAKTLPVTENGSAVTFINELEYIKGFIFANIWQSNTIVKINPATGAVVAKLDLSALAYQAQSFHQGSMEMNGIAYDSISNHLFVTGKMWPKIFEIEIAQ